MRTYRMRLEGDLGRALVPVRVDLRTGCSLIRPDVAERLATLLPPGPTEEGFRRVSGLRRRATHAILADVRLGGRRHACSYFVVPTLREEVVIGAHFLRVHRFIFDRRRGRVRAGGCCMPPFRVYAVRPAAGPHPSKSRQSA